MRIEATECVHSLIIFPLAPKWKQLLIGHRCTFGVDEEYGEILRFPDGTTRTQLWDRGQPTNRARILFADGLELREVLDDEDTGKCWLLLVLNCEWSDATYPHLLFSPDKSRLEKKI